MKITIQSILMYLVQSDFKYEWIAMQNMLALLFEAFLILY